MSIAFGEFTLDWNRRQLLGAGGPVHLSPKALELLRVLLERRPGVVPKAELHERLWPDTFISDATLTSLVAELRHGIADSVRQPRFVRTVHRFGYAFCGEAAEVPEVHLAPAKTAISYWVIWDTGQAPLREGENILGRDRGVAVWFDSVGVSRRHARIVIANGESVVEDLESKNGTYVGGERISSARRLEDGDRISLGSVLVTFRVTSAAASTQSQVAPPGVR